MRKHDDHSRALKTAPNRHPQAAPECVIFLLYSICYAVWMASPTTTRADAPLIAGVSAKERPPVEKVGARDR